MRIPGQFYQLLCAYFGLMPTGCLVDQLTGAFPTAHVFPRLAKQIVASGVGCPNSCAVCVLHGTKNWFADHERIKNAHHCSLCGSEIILCAHDKLGHDLDLYNVKQWFGYPRGPMSQAML